MRARIAVAALLRRELAGEAAAPGLARAWRLGEAAAAELAALPDAAALAASDEALLAAEPDGAAGPAEFAARLARLAARGAEDEAAFDPDRASPAELLARALCASGR